MKRLFLCLILEGICHECPAQFIYNPLPVKGADFKQVDALGYTRCSVYKLVGGNKVLYQVTEYGAQGYLAALYERGVNDAGDSINIREDIYKYDGKGMLSGITYTDKEAGETDAPSAYTYNAKGQLVKKVIAVTDPPTDRYKYDTKGRLTEVMETVKMPENDKNGNFTGKGVDIPAYCYTYHYDAKGRLAEERQFWLRNSVKSKVPDYRFTWTYDVAGRVIKTSRTKGPAAAVSSTGYEYDKDGMLSRSTTVDGDDRTECMYEWCKGCRQSWMQ